MTKIINYDDIITDDYIIKSKSYTYDKNANFGLANKTTYFYTFYTNKDLLRYKKGDRLYTLNFEQPKTLQELLNKILENQEMPLAF